MKPRKLVHIFALLVLALVSYGLGMVLGSGPGFAVFIAGGVILELLFWVELVRRIRSGGETT